MVQLERRNPTMGIVCLQPTALQAENNSGSSLAAAAKSWFIGNNHPTSPLSQVRLSSLNVRLESLTYESDIEELR
jgi:hypothetical protein